VKLYGDNRNPLKGRPLSSKRGELR